MWLCDRNIMLRALRQFCMLYRKLPIENVHVPCINSENKKTNDDRDTNCGWSSGWKTGEKKLISVVCTVKITPYFAPILTNTVHIWYRELQVCIKAIHGRRCQRPEFTYKWQEGKRWWVGGIPLTTRSFTKLAISLGSPLFSTDSDLQHMWWKGHVTIDYWGIRKSMSSCECLPAFRAAIVRAAHYDKLLTFR